MITDKERRDVAARLREMARQYNDSCCGIVRCGDLPAPVDDAMHTCGIGRVVYSYELFNRLADLIEPEPKRTCRVIECKGGRLECSECLDSDPCLVDALFCPCCGAEVVD